MSSDRLLDELARVAREERDRTMDDDTRWQALADGTLSPEAQAELQRRAQGDPETARQYEAYRPLSDAWREQMAGKIVVSPPSTPPAKVTPLLARRRPTRSLTLALAASLAVAAGATLWLTQTPPDGGAVASLDQEALPPYALTVTEDKATRATTETPAADVAEFRADSRVEIVLRPKTAVKGARVDVRSFLLRDGVARAWTPPLQISPDGAVRIAGEAKALFAEPGDWEVALAVGRTGDLPSDPATVAAEVRRPSAEPHPWQLLVRRVRMNAAP
jgi:hypothetical protein